MIHTCCCTHGRYHPQHAAASDTDRFAKYFHGMLARGVYVAPSQFEALFVSLAHGDEEIDETVVAAEGSLAELDRT